MKNYPHSHFPNSGPTAVNDFLMDFASRKTYPLSKHFSSEKSHFINSHPINEARKYFSEYIHVVQKTMNTAVCYINCAWIQCEDNIGQQFHSFFTARVGSVGNHLQQLYINQILIASSQINRLYSKAQLNQSNHASV